MKPPVILTRSAWTQRARTGSPISLPVEKLIAHHSVTGDPGVIEGARLIERIHQENGWDGGAGYNWVLSLRDARFAELRGSGRSGAHTRGHNTTGHAVCVLGNFQDNPFPDHGVALLAAFARWHGDQGYGPGEFTHGHRDLGGSLCPGVNLYRRLPEVNKLAGSKSSPEVIEVEQEFIMASEADLRRVIREEVGVDTVQRERVNEAVRLGEAAAAGAVAAIRRELGMPADPKSDYVHVKRIRETPNQGYTLEDARARLEEAALSRKESSDV